MSNANESTSNGFTAVNDGDTAQNLAVKALNHKEWSNTNGNSSNDYNSPGSQNAPQQSDKTDTKIGDENLISAQLPPSTPGTSNSSEAMEIDARGSTSQAPLSETNGNTYMDDAHMAHLLQQNTQHDVGSQNHIDDDSSFVTGKSALESSPPAHAADSGDAPIITNAGLQVDMKKRKRAFANRTKTGCATCRKRKKKCDEGKPACGNCIRGGFTCLGYSQKKDVGNRGTNPPRTTNPHIAPATRYWEEPSTRTARGPSFDEGINGLPPSLHDSRAAPIQDHRALPSWPGSSYSTSRSLSERPTPPLPPPPMFGLSRDMSLGSRHTTYSPMATAQNAYKQSTFDGRLEFPQRPTSVENGPTTHMQKDNRFQPREPVLKKDRDDCRALCAKLNTAINEGSGPEEIHRRLQSIVQPSGRGSSPPGSPSKCGAVGKNVTVDAPFRADYGFNLNIGDDVVIEGGCVFKDPASIFIGANTRIGTNVVITGEHMMHESKWQTWSRKIPIRIGHGCVIGTGCIIAALDTVELIIGDNVYIAPGSVITKDLPHSAYISTPRHVSNLPHDEHHTFRPM